ncbi:MAG: DUF4423 domain-containing protein [Bdellovibrionales bacterium]
MVSLHMDSVADVLNAEFARRKKRNRAYSLRAYARDLKISVSSLCDILKGKQGLSEAKTEEVARSLARRPLERQFFRDLVLAEFARNSLVRASARKRVQEMRKAESFRRVREDQFRVISEWYHSAILELIQLKDFDPHPAWIGRRLGIPATTASHALKRLEGLGLISQTADGLWRARPEAYYTFSEVPSKSIRRFHMQILSMHADSLREDPLVDREFLSMIFAIPRSRLPEFKEAMKTFATRFWQQMEDKERNEVKDDLYSLSLQLCPVRNRRPGGPS